MGIVILGAGGHAGVIADLIEAATGRNRPGGGISFLDDSTPSGTMVYGYPVEGKIADCMKYPAGTEFIIGIGDNRLRSEIAARYDLNYITLIHPGAVIGGNVRLGKGTVVMAGAVVGCGTHIGGHCIINTGGYGGSCVYTGRFRPYLARGASGRGSEGWRQELDGNWELREKRDFHLWERNSRGGKCDCEGNKTGRDVPGRSRKETGAGKCINISGS